MKEGGASSMMDAAWSRVLKPENILDFMLRDVVQKIWFQRRTIPPCSIRHRRTHIRSRRAKRRRDFCPPIGYNGSLRPGEGRVETDRLSHELPSKPFCIRCTQRRRLRCRRMRYGTYDRFRWTVHPV